MIYPLWRRAKSDAHIAAYLSLDSTKVTSKVEGSDAAFCLILALIDSSSGRRIRNLKKSGLMVEMEEWDENLGNESFKALKEKSIYLLLFPGAKIVK